MRFRTQVNRTRSRSRRQRDESQQPRKSLTDDRSTDGRSNLTNVGPGILTTLSGAIRPVKQPQSDPAAAITLRRPQKRFNRMHVRGVKPTLAYGHSKRFAQLNRTSRINGACRAGRRTRMLHRTSRAHARSRERIIIRKFAITDNAVASNVGVSSRPLSNPDHRAALPRGGPAANRRREH